LIHGVRGKQSKIASIEVIFKLNIQDGLPGGRNMAIRIGRRTKHWLRSIHILVFGIWIGAGLSSMAIQFFKDSGDLQTYFAAMQVLDILIIPAGFLTLITGLLLAWLAGWGFFRHFFVVYSLAVTVITIIVGAVIIGPDLDQLRTLASSHGIQASQVPEYRQTMQIVTIASTIQLILIVSVVFISVLKPFRRSNVKAEAAGIDS
jgi:hypothetical protein